MRATRVLDPFALVADVLGSTRAAVPADVDGNRATVVASREAGAAQMDDSLFGRNGTLGARLVSASRALDRTSLAQRAGDSAELRQDVYAVPDGATTRPFSCIALVSSGAKSGGRIGSHRVGVWPSERGSRKANPAGFIRVTRENQETHVSEHFQLRDLVTRDRKRVRPVSA
jgi:hypothetical protein